MWNHFSSSHHSIVLHSIQRSRWYISDGITSLVLNFERTDWTSTASVCVRVLIIIIVIDFFWLAFTYCDNNFSFFSTSWKRYDIAPYSVEIHSFNSHAFPIILPRCSNFPNFVFWFSCQLKIFSQYTVLIPTVEQNLSKQPPSTTNYNG